MNVAETTVTFKVQFSDDEASDAERIQVVKGVLASVFSNLRREFADFETELHVRVRMGDVCVSEFREADKILQ